MSVLKSFAGQDFNLPLNREPKSSNWGTEVSNFLIRVADYAIPKTGGLFALQNELNLGSGHGLKLPYIKSSSAAISSESPAFMLLANADRLSWRNAADDGNLALSVATTNRLQWTGQNVQLSGDAASSNTASKLVLRDANGDFAARNITAASFIGPISGGVTGNVTGNLTGNADTASKLQTARTVTLSGDVAGSVAFDGSANITINATINPDSVALGTDTTGNYVASVAGTADQVLASGSGEGAAVTLSLPQSIATTSSPTFQKITLSGTPASAQDAATKDYVDSVAKGLDVKGSVIAATTGNISLSGLQVIDGVSLVDGDRVLVKNQSTASQNGIYVSAAGAWARSSDMDAWAKVPGAFAFVEQGSSLADTGWVSTANAGGTLGSTAVTFTQFFGAGTYSADGQGLELAGTQFSLELDGTSLAKSGTGLKVNIAGSPVGTSDTQTLLNKKVSSTAAMTGALELPAGTTAERPISPTTGQVRFNSDKAKFEGYGSGVWDTIGGGGGLVTEAKAVSFTAIFGKHYLCNTSGGAITVTLPAGGAEAIIRLSDASETWNTYAVTITPAAGEKIDNLATNETLVCDVKRGWVELSWNTALSSWSLQSLSATNVVEASATQAGVVSTGAQTFAGIKTFQDAPVIANATGIVAASATVPGVVTTGTQTFAGAKTFTDGTRSIVIGNDVNEPYFGTTTNNSLRILSNNIERMRVHANGNVSIGTVASGSKLNIGGGPVDVVYSAGAGNTTYYRMEHAGSTIVYHNVSSNTNYDIVNFGNGVRLALNGNSWGAISDERKKKNIKSLEYGLTEIEALRPVRFDYKTEETNDSARVGFIAQELAPVIKEAVQGSEDTEYSVTSSDLIPVLVKAIQELSAKVDAQAAQLAQLLPPVEPAPIEVIEPQPVVEEIVGVVEQQPEPVADQPAQEPLAEQTPVEPVQAPADQNPV